MKNIIELAGRYKKPTKIIVGDAITALESFLPPKKIFIITDANLHRRYKELINKYEYLLMGIGETSKTLQTAEMIYRELISMGADRESFILGIGGGVVTDMTGYVASTFMRGVDFGFVATSLLAQVDAAIGGKNGVNVDGYKNMVGTFSQPDFVLCDTSMLATLPDREFASGLAEAIKAAIIADYSLFEELERSDITGLRNDSALLLRIISGAVRVKAAIVERDEREDGVRKLLNLGHTFGHAIESNAPQFTHGEAVAIGIIMTGELSKQFGMLSEEQFDRIVKLLEKMNLPTSVPLDSKKLFNAVLKDKKRDGEQINMVLIKHIGECQIVQMNLNQLKDSL